MKLNIHLEEGDNDTPIEMANAIINFYINQIPKSYPTEDDVEYNLHKLEAVADHIKVYLKHRSYANNRVWR